jgi:hypothetical protein
MAAPHAAKPSIRNVLSQDIAAGIEHHHASGSDDIVYDLTSVVRPVPLAGQQRSSRGWRRSSPVISGSSVHASLVATEAFGDLAALSVYLARTVDAGSSSDRNSDCIAHSSVGDWKSLRFACCRSIPEWAKGVTIVAKRAAISVRNSIIGRRGIAWRLFIAPFKSAHIRGARREGQIHSRRPARSG